MPGWENRISFNNAMAIEPTASEEAFLAQRRASDTSVSFYNSDGSPEGVFEANPGSMCCDRTNGKWYRKASGSGNTGWVINDDLYITPYIVDSNDAGGNSYTTIQSAINQAVIDGASVTSPKFIYVRFGSYIEDLSIPPGVKIIGSSDQFTVLTTQQVYIQGNHTCDDVNFVFFQNIFFNNTLTDGTPLFTNNGSSITYGLNNCVLQSSSGAGVFFDLVSAGIENRFYKCTFGGTIGEDSFTGSGTTNFSLCIFTDGQFNTSANLYFHECVNVFDISSTGNIFGYQSNFMQISGTGNVELYNCIVQVPITNTGNLKYQNLGGISSTGIYDSNPTLIPVKSSSGNIYSAIRSATNISLSSDTNDRRYVGITDTSAPRSVTFNANPSLNQVTTVKDESGGALINNITVNTPGSETIDGAASYVINTNYGSMSFIYDGSNYFTYN